MWDRTVFSKNRDRLIGSEVAARFPAAILKQPRVKALISDEQFSIDGTLVDVWASMKSFQRKDDKDDGTPLGRAAELDFRGRRARLSP